MEWECSAPYDSALASTTDRLNSCKRGPNGKFGSRQNCVESCIRKPKPVTDPFYTAAPAPKPSGSGVLGFFGSLFGNSKPPPTSTQLDFYKPTQRQAWEWEADSDAEFRYSDYYDSENDMPLPQSYGYAPPRTVKKRQISLARTTKKAVPKKRRIVKKQITLAAPQPRCTKKAVPKRRKTVTKKQISLAPPPPACKAVPKRRKTVTKK